MLKSTSACSPALLVELPFQTLGQVWFLAVSNETVAAGAFQKSDVAMLQTGIALPPPLCSLLARPDACTHMHACGGGEWERQGDPLPQSF